MEPTAANTLRDWMERPSPLMQTAVGIRAILHVCLPRAKTFENIFGLPHLKYDLETLTRAVFFKHFFA